MVEVNESLKAPIILSCPKPIACSTCDGLMTPDEQADPEDIESFPSSCLIMAKFITKGIVK